jgi:nucleoside-diphosphate-sugar epimerase
VRVFLAGASGVIGSALVPKLVAAGHEVTGMTRSEERAGAVREAGAAAVVRDVFDEQGLREDMGRAAPEVVLHEVTALPEAMDFEDPASFEPTNRIRREGTRILVDAAREAGARRLIAQSIAFYYEPSGGWIKDEDAPTWTDPPGPYRDATDALRSLEATVTGAPDLEGLVLRYGQLYGPGTSYAADGSIAELVRKRRFPIVGGGHGTFSFVHLSDAADATVAALDRGGPGIYNVVDDEPAPVHDWLPAYAQELGAKRPLKVPKWLARLLAGPTSVAFATTMRGASNAKAGRELGWTPAHPSWRGSLVRGL